MVDLQLLTALEKVSPVDYLDLALAALREARMDQNQLAAVLRVLVSGHPPTSAEIADFRRLLDQAEKTLVRRAKQIALIEEMRAAVTPGPATKVVPC